MNKITIELVRALLLFASIFWGFFLLGIYTKTALLVAFSLPLSIFFLYGCWENIRELEEQRP